MRIRLTQIMTSVMAAVVMVSFGGCSEVHFDSPVPQVGRQRIELPVPDDGLKYPLGTPTDQEKAGILLRCKAQPQKLRYDSQIISFMDIVRDEGYKKTERHSEIVRFVPAPDGTNLIREGETKLGLLGSLRLRVLISPRGACLKTPEANLTGYAGLATNLWPREQVSFAADTTARFPEDPVRIGREWIQAGYEETKHTASKAWLQNPFHSLGVSATVWRCLGVADVRGRRCAVLQGMEEKVRVAERDWRWSESERNMIVYFDYVHGIDVEYIAAGPESSDVVFVQISLVE